MRTLFIFFLVLCRLSFGADFDFLLGKESHFWRKLADVDTREIQFYRAQFSTQYPLLARAQETKIPKVLHWIWVGPKSFPETSILNVQSWKQRHPSWTLKFWTDDPQRPCPVEGMERHLISEIPFKQLHAYLNKTENFAEKADLIRYEILYSEGGIYVDHDVECFHPFDALNETYTFYACLEPPHRIRGFKTRVFPSNGLFAAVPQHPILLKTLTLVEQKWEVAEREFTGTDPKIRFLKVMNRTFSSFAESVRENLNRDGYCDIIFPASFFFSEPIFSLEQIHHLKTEHLVLASHKFAGTWLETDKKKSELDALIAKSKQKQKALEKKMRNWVLMTVGNFCLTILLLLGLFSYKPTSKHAQKH